MRLLYFDTATSTGWAFGPTGGEPVWGSFELPRTNDDIFTFLKVFKRHVEKLVDAHKPDEIGFESPILSSKDNPLKLRKLYGLTIKVEEVAGERELPCQEAPVNEVKAHMLGRNYPRDSERSKLLIRVECRKSGWDIKNSDEADALAGWDYLQTLRDPNHPIPRLQRIAPRLSRA